ncbi:MAG: M42 family peptidase [Thermoleophilia bacterium]
MRPELEATCDRVDVDAMGSLLGFRAGTGDGARCRVMLAAHMDEIGLMVTHVDAATGFLNIIPLGGWDARTLVSQRVVVHGREAVDGVVGTPPVHVLKPEDRDRAPKLTDLVIDTGILDGRITDLVRPGDVATRSRRLQQMGDLISGKALDDRVGVFIMLEALRMTEPATADLYAVAAVQEEVGLRGSRTATHRVNPHVGVAIDTCPSGDGPGQTGGGTKLGDGAAIRVADASAIASHRVVEFLERLAVDRGIPHQFHVSDKGGTDTASLQLARDGSLAGCISIPSRYGHSSVEACHPGDIQACIDLTVALIEHAHELIPEG